MIFIGTVLAVWTLSFLVLMVAPGGSALSLYLRYFSYIIYLFLPVIVFATSLISLVSTKFLGSTKEQENVPKLSVVLGVSFLISAIVFVRMYIQTHGAG